MSYVSNIAESIIRHCSRNAILGPEVYTAIAEWEKREIPEEVVLVSISEVCSSANNASGKQLPIEAFQKAVIRNFRRWLSKPELKFAADC